MDDWKIGDRVQRREDVFDDRSKWMHGQVVDIRRIDGRPEIRVKWDERELIQAYLSHGIQPEEPVGSR
jgi:hypothetical protein